MGLLDNMFSNPAAMASMGILSMPTRSRTPLNPMAYALQGAMGAQQYKQQQQQMEQEKTLLGLKLKEYETAQADKQRQQSALSVLQNPQASEQERSGALWAVDPKTAASRFFPEPQKPMAVAAGSSLVDPTSGKPLFTAPDKPNEVTRKIGDEFVTLRVHADGREEEISRAPRYKPANTSIQLPPQEKEYDKAQGKYYAGLYQSIQDSARTTGKREMNFAQIDKLLDGVYTGAGGDAIQAGRKLAAMFGMDTNVGSAEAAKALANEIALQLRNPAGGAGMPGALSDRDLQFLQSMNPNLAMTPQGRKTLLSVTKRIAQRERQIAKEARDYQMRNGRLDGGFEQVLMEKYGSQDLFSDLMGAPNPVTQTPSGEGVVVDWNDYVRDYGKR